MRPCTGSGTWRRKPDAKWRVKPANIPERQAEQVRVLDLGAGLTKPGGTLVYVTCSVLPEENRDQVEAFLARHGDFAVEPFARASGPSASAASRRAPPTGARTRCN